MSDTTKAVDRAKDAMADALETAREEVSEGIDRARDRFEDLAEEVGDRVRSSGEGFRRRAERAGQFAKDKYGVAKESLRQGYTKVRKDVGELSTDVNEYVRDNPGKSILIAAAAGFVLGLLVRGRRDDD